MATDPIKAIGFTNSGKVATQQLKPLKPLGEGGVQAIGFDQANLTTPAPIEGQTPSEQFTEGYIPGTSLKDRLAENQNGWDQFANFMAQTGIEALAGTVEAGSYLADFEQHFNKLRGEEKEYSNWLAEEAKKIKEEGRTSWAPVYVSEENEGFQPMSAEWWAHNGGQGLGSTLSLLIPGTIAAKVGKLAGLGAIGQTVTATVASRYAESTMEANAVYEEALKAGASKEQAGQAASKVWNTNWLFAIQDFAQFGAITKGFNATSKGAKGTGFGKFLSQMASEGAEEAGQYIVSEEGKRVALGANTDYFGEGFSKRLADYVNDDEFKTSVLLGAVGGGVFQAAGSIMDKLADVEQGTVIPKIKERVEKLFSRGIQKEVANAVDDKITSQAITNIDFGQQFIDNFNKGRLPEYKAELEELKKQAGIPAEARQSIDTHINDIDFLMTEEAKLRNSTIPQDMHKPILLNKLETNQNLALSKQIERELDETYTKATERGLPAELVDFKKLQANSLAYSKLAEKNPQFSQKMQNAIEAYNNQTKLVEIAVPEYKKKITTDLDDKINQLTLQSVSTKEKLDQLKADSDRLTTPEGIAAYKQAEAQKKIDQEALAVLSNPAATKDQIIQAQQNTGDTKIKSELAKKLDDLINKDKQANIDILQDVVDSTQPEDAVTPDIDPNELTPEDILPPELDPNMELMPDEMSPELEPEVDFAGGLTNEQASRWGLSKKETEDLVSKVDVETRKPKQPTDQAKDKNDQAEEVIREKTTVSTTALNSNSAGNTITYHNNITGEVATAEQIFAIDSATGHLIVNTPRIQPGLMVTLKLENDFPWTQQAGFKPNSKDNFTINVYIEGVQRPIAQLRNADNKYLKADEKVLNSRLRDLILLSPTKSVQTTIASKNIGTPRTDNVLRSLEILEADFIQGQEGKWQMQNLPHAPIFGMIDHNGGIHTPNIGAMRDITKNPNIENRVEDAIHKYATAADLKKLAGRAITFRTAPDGTLRMIGLEYRNMTDAERGWVRNNLDALINTKNFDALKEMIYIPQHPSGVYKHTTDKGKPKVPDVVKLDRHRFHIVTTSEKTSDFLIPILGKNKERLWIVVQNTQLNALLNNGDFTYKIIDQKGNKSPFNNAGKERIIEAFDKVLGKQFKNINETNLNSEIQYTDPSTNQVYPTFYDYLVKTQSLQTKLKGSVTMGVGEDSSYSFNQVSLYLDPNPSETKIDLTEKTITIQDQSLEPSKDKDKSSKSTEELLKEYFDQDEPLLKPYSSEGYSFEVMTEKEINWFKEHIGEEYLTIAKNVDKFIAANGVQAFGQYYNSLVTVADYAPAGTLYHEAGHFLLDPKNGLVTPREKEKILDEGSNIFNIKRSHDSKNEPKLKAVDYKLRAVEILQSPKAEEVFKKGEKNKWDLNKILSELAIPKEQKELILSLNTSNREEIIQELVQQYTYVVEVKISKTDYPNYESEITPPSGPVNSDFYSNMTVPGGTNYTENEIKTPDITPSIKGHAQFSTDKGIGWFRSDEQRSDDNTGKRVPDGAGGLVQLGVIGSKTRRILEVQSDLFQKGRDQKTLVKVPFFKKAIVSKNNFLQLLNKDSNWVSFFLKSIVQDSANKGYEKVLFPTGNTANKVEGMGTIEEFVSGKTARRDSLIQYRIKYSSPDIITEVNGQFLVNRETREVFKSREDAEKEVKIILQSQTNEINQINAELERVEREGLAAIAPIYKFYEDVVGNILKKLYKDQIKRVKDEYGNEWYELTLKEEHKGTIRLKPIIETEQSGDYQIEEKIMEEWEKYKLSDGQYKPKVATAKGFFRRLLQMIKNILGFKSPLEKLFYRMSSVRRSDINITPGLEDKSEPAFKILPGFYNALHQREAVQSFASEVMRLANEIARNRNIDLLDLFTNKVYVDEVFNTVKNSFQADYAKVAAIPRDERTHNEKLRYASYLAMGIGKSTLQDESVLNGEYEDVQREGLSPVEGFKTKVLKDLGRWGFRVKLGDNTVYEVPQTDDEQVEKQELKSDDEAERLYDIDSTQINPTDSLSQRIRLFLSTVPEPVISEGKPTSEIRRSIFGTPKYIDFRKIDAALTLKLVNSVDPLVRLNILSETDPISKAVLDRLMDEKNKGNEQVYTEFFVKYRRDSYTKKTVLLEKKREFVKPEDRIPGEGEYRTVHKSKLIDTDRNSVDRVVLNKWREEGVRKQVVETDGAIIQRKAVSVRDEFNQFKAKFIAAKDKKANLPYEELKTKFDVILKSIGVDIPVQLWVELDALKPAEKYTMLQGWMFGLKRHSLEDLIAKYVDGIDPFSGSNILSDLAERSIAYVENLSRGAYLNESGDQEYPNNTPSYITEFINNAKENPEDVVTRFQQDDFYARNEFLGVIRDKAKRSNLELHFTSSIREGEKDPKNFESRSEIESLIMRMTAFHNNAGNSAFINVGTPSDKTKQPMLALPKYKGTSAKDFLMTVLNRNIDSESVRIQRLKKSLTWVLRKDQPLPTDIKNLQGNAKFVYVPALNTIPNLADTISTGDVSTPQYKEARNAAQVVLNKFIEDEYETFLKFLEDNNIVTLKKNKEGLSEIDRSIRIPEGILYDEKGTKTYTHESFLKEFFYNDLAWRFEVSKVFQGDMALYSSQDDYFKRQYQLVTPGYKPLPQLQGTITRGIYGKQFKVNYDPKLPESETNNVEYLVQLAKLVRPSTTSVEVKDAIKTGKSNIPIINEIIKYNVVNKTDAQSLMTITSYRALADSLGQWTEDHEAVYQFAWKDGIPIRKAVADALKAGLINEDQATTYRVLAGKVLLQPFKPFVFRDVPITLPDGKIMMIKEQIKDSITVITPELSNVSKGFKDLLNYMTANQIDIMSAEDTVKVGAYGVIKDFSVPAAKWQKRVTDISDFKFPQFIPDKKKEEVSGTQTHKLVLGNINPETKYQVGNKERTGKQVIEDYNEYWAEKIENSSKDLKKRLGLTSKGLQLSEDPQKRADQLFKLHLLLKQELGEREINENYWDVLDLVKKGVNQVDFTLPISFPAFGPKFQSILTNLWKKNVIKQKSPGYSAVNLADFGVGYSDELKFVQNENGEIVEAEVGLPIEYVGDIGLKYGEHILPSGTILWDKLNENQKEALQFILYRIPTSNKSSMLPVRVARITPPQLNNIVMMPGELTIQQGLDFDVDKSQLIRRVLDKEGKPDKDDVDTKLFNLYWGILTNKAHTLELLTPLASPTMEAKLEQFRKDGIIQSVERGSPLSTTADVQAEVRNKDGKAEIGIASRFNTGHTVLQTIRDFVRVEGGINITYKNKNFTEIGGTVDADGVLISTNHAESQQAALDAAKNPLLAYFNVVKGTMAAFHTMLEFGIPLPMAIDFFMQPVVKEWTKFYKHEGQVASRATEKLFTTYPAVRGQYDLIRQGRLTQSLNDSDLRANLIRSVDETHSHSARVLVEFLNILELSNQLSNINNVISVDTFQDATGLEALQSFIEQRSVATDKSATMYIDPRVFDLENTPPSGKRLASFFKYGIEDAIQYIGQFYPSASQEYEQLRDEYARITGEESITDKRLVKKLNQFTDYFLTQYDSSLFRVMNRNHPLYNEDPKLDKSDYRLRWSFFDPSRSIWKYINSLTDAKDDKGKPKYPILQRNALIKNLESEESRQNEVQVIGVRNTDAQADKTDYIYAWRYLLDSDIPEVKTLGHDLIRYAIQTSGFQYSTRSFFDLIPVQYWVTSGIGNLWDGITKNPKIDVESNIVNFIRHNFRQLDRFPEIYAQNVQGQIKSDVMLNTKQVGKHLREFTLRSDYKENKPLPRFVRVYDWELGDYRLYESDPGDPRAFKEVQPLGGRYFTEVAAARNPSNHYGVRVAYNGVSADPWKGVERKFPMGKTFTGTGAHLSKYIPGGKSDPETVLRILLANEPDVQARNTIEVLLRNVDKINTPIEVTTISDYAGVLRAIGDKEGNVNTIIQINPLMNSDSEAMVRYVLLHELTHAYSVAVIQKPEGEVQRNFVRNIDRIRKEFMTKVSGETPYALENNFEFVAELASNKELRKELKKEGFWGRLLRNIRKLFGFKDEFDKALDQFYDVVDHADNLQKIEPTEFALRQQEKEIKGAKRIGVLQQILSSLSAREKELRRRWKRTEANELQKERKILEELVGTNRNQAVVRYLIHTEKEVAQLKSIYNNLVKDPKSINSEAINSMRDQLISYDVISTLSDRIYDHPTDFVPEGGDVDTMLKQLNQLSADVSRLLKKVERLGIKRFAQFIKDSLADPNMSVEQIEDNLTVADRDIVWSSRWTDPGLDIEDPAIKAIATRIKDNAAQAYRNIQEDLYSTTPEDKVADMVTLEPTFDGLRQFWKHNKIKYKSVGFIKALTEYEAWIKKHRPKSDTFADKFAPILDPNSKAENDDGVHFINPLSKEGKAIMNIKEGSTDYPLRQFYETVVLGYLKSQEEIAEYNLRPGLRIPSIGRGLMEGFIREKGLKNTASVFKEQFLNNFRERFDETDYQPVDQSGKPRQDVALRFTSVQDGKEGRLSTREVSLDIANTIPLFVHEMYMRKGLVELKDDLEIGKSILANRKVLKTKRVEGKGLASYLTRAKENIPLESGEFDSITGKESKSYEAYDSFLRRFVYGQYKAREGAIKVGDSFKASVAKSFDFLLRMTGAKLMLFNVAIPLTNYVATEFTFIKEVVGGNIIDKGNWLAGQKLYGEAALAALQDLSRREKKTHFGRIFTYFNPMDTERPVTNLGVDSNWMRTILHKVSSGGEIFEYKVAVNAMGAVMDRFKVKNSKGEEQSLYEGLNVTQDGKVTLKDGYTYEGSKTLKPEVIDQVIQYTLRLYQSATGIRNKMDATGASEFVVGRAVEFMRKWLKPGLNARFKTKHFDEKIQQENEGHYVSSLILFNNIFGRNGWVRNMKDSLKTLVFMSEQDPELLLLPEELALSEERKQEIINLRQANIRKSTFELYAITALSMLLWFGWDEDDDESYLRYMTARARRELMTFISPTTAWEVLRSPTVALNTIEGFQRIGASMIGAVGAAVSGEEQPIYKLGPYKDQERWSADLERQFIPFRKQFEDMDRKTNLIIKGGIR